MSVTSIEQKTITKPKVGLLKNILPWLGLLPFILFCVAFELLPMAFMVVGSFLETKSGAFTISNYLDALSKPFYLNAFLNSIYVSLITAGVGTVLGGLVAYSALTSRWGWIRNGVITLSNVTANFAGVPLAFAFVATLGSTGIVSVFLEKSMGIDFFSKESNLYKFGGLCLVYIYFQLPLMVLLITPALKGLRREWHEAAANLGASVWQYWQHVGFPVLFPALAASFVLLMANAFGAYATVYALAQGYINLTPIQIGFLINGDIALNTGLANALATLMIVLMVGMLFAYQRLNKRSSRWIK
jgi:putative spermidine/putrescine transport system permease protein